MHSRIKAPGFVSFISSPSGRILRVVAGIALLSAGISMATTGGYVLAALGIVPLAAGSLDICVLGPILGGHFNGRLTRQTLHQQQGRPELGERSKSWIMA